MGWDPLFGEGGKLRRFRGEEGEDGYGYGVVGDVVAFPGAELRRRR